MRTLRVALAQINTAVGDLEGNSKKVVEYAERARDAGADLVAFPELTLPGYPPEDLVLYPGFVADGRTHLMEVSTSIQGTSAVIGFIGGNDDHKSTMHNSAALVSEGNIINIYDKIFLPNYGVFDEKRYFSSGDGPCVVELNGIRVGLTICEDMWHYGPVEESVAAGAEIIININASPFSIDKADQRETHIVSKRAKQNALPILYLNMVGGQDELVFDGNSTVFDNNGNTIFRAAEFKEGLFEAHLD